MCGQYVKSSRRCWLPRPKLLLRISNYPNFLDTELAQILLAGDRTRSHIEDTPAEDVAIATKDPQRNEILKVNTTDIILFKVNDIEVTFISHQRQSVG